MARRVVPRGSRSRGMTDSDDRLASAVSEVRRPVSKLSQSLMRLFVGSASPGSALLRCRSRLGSSHCDSGIFLHIIIFIIHQPPPPSAPCASLAHYSPCSILSRLGRRP